MPSKAKQKSQLLLGAHLSISGGLHKALIRAETLKCNVLQIFTKNASTWREKKLSNKQIEAFNKTRRGSGIRCITSHSPYLINLASNNSEIREKSVAALEQELIRCGQLDLPWLVLHPGSHMG